MSGYFTSALKLLFIVIFAVIAGLIVATLMNNYTNNKKVNGDFSDLMEDANSDLVLYTASGCEACIDAKDELIKNNISFEERDIYVNKKWATDLNMRNINSVPVLVRSRFIVIGYIPNEYVGLAAE